ncbi:MAG: sugar phosphate nucleotidyltransferase [Candidatus Latescibacterota bacterium]|nr:sugar phosphate nucleotidyltransferase [Candidatus Latescibacterota bacterium]
MKFVIRAGGVGTRLWPYSRQSKPKQFHNMAGDRTMLQDAVERIAPIAGMPDIYVSTGRDMEQLVREQLPDLPEDHLIVEPALRNTGPAVALECALLQAHEPGCTIASLGSDHYIGLPDEFCRLLKAAETAATEFPEYLFTIGVRPTRPETGYGYIRKGDELTWVGEDAVYRAIEFTEKPNENTAQSYADTGEYLWNTNMFVWRSGTVLELFKQHAPEVYERVQTIAETAATGGDWRAAVEREYRQMPRVAVDNAIIEPAAHVATLEGVLNWGDIGTWAALTDVIDADAHGNLLRGRVVSIDARGTTAYGSVDKIIALVGVEDLIVVDTPDALLVCPKDQAQRVREVLERLREDDELKAHI